MYIFSHLRSYEAKSSTEWNRTVVWPGNGSAAIRGTVISCLTCGLTYPLHTGRVVHFTVAVGCLPSSVMDLSSGKFSC